jgi:hypothetical protein
MRVTDTPAVELVFHDMTGRVAVGAGVHRTGDLLRQNAALCHGVSIIDFRFIKIRRNAESLR